MDIQAMLTINNGNIRKYMEHVWKYEPYRIELYGYQWEFQDPKIDILYHIRPYSVGIFPYIGLL